MDIAKLSDELLQDLDVASNDALGNAIGWSEAQGLQVHVHAAGEVRHRRVRWVLVVLAMHGDATIRWWEFPIDHQRGAGPMRLLLLIELMTHLSEQRRRRTLGRPYNSVVAVGTA